MDIHLCGYDVIASGKTLPSLKKYMLCMLDINGQMIKGRVEAPKLSCKDETCILPFDTVACRGLCFP